MLRVSDYNICLPLQNNEKEYILVHGYSGAFDVVSEDIYLILKTSENQPSMLNLINPDNLAILEERGYVTPKNPEEEKETLCKISSLFKKIREKRHVITIIPTYSCNFRCAYCFEHGLLGKGRSWLSRVMSRETVDSIFHQVHLFREEDRVLNGITLFGGEPLLKRFCQ